MFCLWLHHFNTFKLTLKKAILSRIILLETTAYFAFWLVVNEHTFYVHLHSVPPTFSSLWLEASQNCPAIRDPDSVVWSPIKQKVLLSDTFIAVLPAAWVLWPYHKAEDSPRPRFRLARSQPSVLEQAAVGIAFSGLTLQQQYNPKFPVIAPWHYQILNSWLLGPEMI